MEDNIEFKYRVAQVLSNEFRQDDIVPVCATPEVPLPAFFSATTIGRSRLSLQSVTSTMLSGCVIDCSIIAGVCMYRGIPYENV